jgi:small acid-soluble spore protein P (minor)
MSKPKTTPVPEAQAAEQHGKPEKHSSMQEPLSGSKKVKNQNHVDHNNPQG